MKKKKRANCERVTQKIVGVRVTVTVKVEVFQDKKGRN